MRARVTVYQDKAGGWRWRFTVNGRIMAASGEGYTRRRQAWRAWDHFRFYCIPSTDPLLRPKYAEYTTEPSATPRDPLSALKGRGVTP